MKYGLLSVLLLALATPAPALAHELSPDQIATVGITQHTGDSLPLDTAFVDEDGLPVALARYFDNARPVLLSLNYFHCQYVCPIEEDGLIAALNGITNLTLGRDFSLLTVSIDQKDGPADASDIKARGLRGYDRPDGVVGWHLLTGNTASIQRLTDALGYHAVADPEQGDFAHPIGVVVLTPQGRISRYVYGLDFASTDLRSALLAATAPPTVADVLQNPLVVCYQYDPLIGRYTPLALNLVRIGGGLGLAGMLLWLALLWRADLRRQTV